MIPLAELCCPNTVFATGCNQPKEPGCHVRIGANHGPVFVIVHVSGDRAWVRPMSNGAEGLAPLDRLRVV